MTITYLAIGSTYMADGWSPEGPLFTVNVPSEDRAHAIDYARRYAHRGVDGLASHGCEDVRYVQPVASDRRAPRNRDRGSLQLPAFLPPDPMRHLWRLTETLHAGISVERVSDHRRETITWGDLRVAAGEPTDLGTWYKQVLAAAESASL